MTTISKVSSNAAQLAASNAANARAAQGAMNALLGKLDGRSILTSDLFKQLNASGDGNLTKSELESAVVSAGSTKQAADTLFSQLDPRNTGKVTEAQFAVRFPNSRTEKDAKAIRAIVDKLDPQTTLTNALFDKLNSAGNGSLTEAEVERAVALAGGTKAGAQALFRQLDPSGNGTVTEQQFASNLTPAEQRGLNVSLLA